MRFLIDTHVFLWLETEPERLAHKARALLEDTANELYLSAVSGWEIAIKHALGKLPLPADPPIYVPARLMRGGFQSLDVTMSHALAVSGLPAFHDDPFDRLLIAQAQVEGLTLVTVDNRISQYPVRVLNAAI
jgi:PIN domain nuclease of toxin-antitoxin system